MKYNTSQINYIFVVHKKLYSFGIRYDFTSYTLISKGWLALHTSGFPIPVFCIHLLPRYLRYFRWLQYIAGLEMDRQKNLRRPDSHKKIIYITNVMLLRTRILKKYLVNFPFRSMPYRESFQLLPVTQYTFGN